MVVIKCFSLNLGFLPCMEPQISLIKCKHLVCDVVILRSENRYDLSLMQLVFPVLVIYKISQYKTACSLKVDDLTVCIDNTFQSLSTQFITEMRCTLSKYKGPVCRQKLVLLYLCSLLLA